ncbi:NAD(P)/FAD-dependent oxidoreductase [Euzebya tangerina]|uniref:NAD(P)/FAD-dependent oxidoreductase n=1 Tax=Euzebya tangerina TaxID=591198 RepID=UPI000E313AF0|nr:FAD-dependent oxidoreductase [Euzebya tangerina]
MTTPNADTLIVGAGLAGLVAARSLVEAGARVTLLDKGRSPGGRLATRYAETGRGLARWDHGAQFFTVRSDEFAALMADWPVRVWHHGPDRAADVTTRPDQRNPGGDGHPRYVGTDGMNGIAKHLAAGLEVQTDVRVSVILPTSAGWTARADDGREWSARRVIVTSPIPQTIDLLHEVSLPAMVTSLTYQPCLGLLATLDSSPLTQAVQFEGGDVHYIADNASKGISRVEAVTVHAGAEWSRAHYDAADADVIAVLSDLVDPWLAGAAITSAQVKRWRYAQPVEPHPERAVRVADGLVLAGDTFGEAKVEGAARSGLAAAALLT